ncbi:MAG: Nif3-like dinuclear metal center hexameric protein [Gammaproteobacteria bacterium]|nr:Nif3-like dinuclear metal center hexameric protein [Rhodocyclaceae bacterium]MBU3908246.1 Nif3-like dinuclear metal center hexameric protein [Gammaproteobacteria bacterium]MBU3990502.1 Nif3-like dinuclear metal center hexameric protein [Gammaproteobacteria bacterium]MBU4003117.1 Nif3-like dinuclear metal center hexameric protein [Gammaproteobacteria bacterium]MBU4019959.1 Nif3-like dinuclear metal center hexameric protein [Gammaproteobacteria bacterium]
MLRDDLGAYLDSLLEAARFRDYCPNGLQVEGRAEVRRIVCGVTASQALIDAAVECAADAILVHHGWFWKNEDGRITGFRKRRMQTLLAHDINLFAYHLPLDAHAELGNNAQLAARLGWTATGRFAEQDIGFIGIPVSAAPHAGHAVPASGHFIPAAGHFVPPAPTFAEDLATQVGQVLGRDPLLVGDGRRLVKKIAWCSGGAQSYFEQAILAGADLYVSGEISENTVHLARESGVPYLAAGHHATERYGVMALGKHLFERFGVGCEYVELDNPV